MRFIVFHACSWSWKYLSAFALAALLMPLALDLAKAMSIRLGAKGSGGLYSGGLGGSALGVRKPALDSDLKRADFSHMAKAQTAEIISRCDTHMQVQGRVVHTREQKRMRTNVWSIVRVVGHGLMPCH